MTAASIAERLAKPGWVAGQAWGPLACGLGRCELRRRGKRRRPSLDRTR
jgi:hypothetical protein